MPQIMGWVLVMLFVFGIVVIVWVTSKSGRRLKKMFDHSGELGIRPLDPGGPEVLQLKEPKAEGLLGLNDSCRIRAVWEIARLSAHVLHVYCRHVQPVAGGNTSMSRRSMVFLVMGSTCVEESLTVHRWPFDNALGAFALKLVERKTGALRPEAGGLDPEFRKVFLAFGPAMPRDYRALQQNPPDVPTPLQDLFVSTLQAGSAFPDMRKVLGMDGSLRISKDGFALSFASNYVPTNAEELRRLLDFLDRLRSVLAAEGRW